MIRITPMRAAVPGKTILRANNDNSYRTDNAIWGNAKPCGIPYPGLTEASGALVPRDPAPADRICRATQSAINDICLRHRGDLACSQLRMVRRWLPPRLGCGTAHPHAVDSCRLHNPPRKKTVTTGQPMPGTNQSPLAVTDDAFKASRLERMPGNFTASYKIYFLKAVFDAAVSGESRVAYDRLAASMVASAWYPVLFFRLNLGATDQLARVVYAAHARLALDRSASRGDVVAAAPFEQARKRSLGEARPRPQGPRDSVGSQGKPQGRTGRMHISETHALTT